MTKGANLRKAPDSTSPVVAVLPRGAGVEVLREEGNWREVRHGDGTGFVHRSLLAPERTAAAEEEVASARGVQTVAYSPPKVDRRARPEPRDDMEKVLFETKELDATQKQAQADFERRMTDIESLVVQ